jgi:hypothetical protein
MASDSWVTTVRRTVRQLQVNAGLRRAADLQLRALCRAKSAVNV